MARATRERVPEIARVAALDAGLPQLLDLMSAAHVHAFVSSARARRLPRATELAFMRELGAGRLLDLFPLEVLMQGVRAGQLVLWNEILAEAGPTADGQSAALALTAFLIVHTDAVSHQLEQSYVTP
jgi:hypothetical protein